MNVTGSIIVHTKTRRVALDRWERIIVDATWEGGPLAYVEKKITYPVTYRIGATISVGPLLLRVVAISEAHNAYIVARDTRLAWLHGWRYRLGQRASLLQSRVIATLAVWELAQWGAGRAPTWGDVYAVRWLRDRVRRVTQEEV